MAQTYAFDVYGTLVNPHAVVGELETLVGDLAVQFSQIWRDKQLEYSFRRGLMNDYQDFSIVTRQALDHTCNVLGIDISEAGRVALMGRYRALDAFDDVAPALEGLNNSGHQMHAFSNGLPCDLEKLLNHAGIANLLGPTISVHAVSSFKPDPKVYAHFNHETGSRAEQTWLVSSNPFDIVGAAAVGWKTAWVKRSKAALFDPWGIEPTKTISTLLDLI